jgi:hypothetical protein
MRKAPDWDALVCADELEASSYYYFPADKVVANLANLAALEGLRFRNCYVTSRAIEEGSGNLFFHLYYNARVTGGKVLHVTDYRETE